MPQAAVVTTEPRARIRHIEGLDGLRAIAAGLVLVYHLIPGWAGIGYIGVDVFFVLSGFLITSLLLARRGGLRDFWARRFRRLFPAALLATIGSAALALLVGGDALVALGRQVIGSLTATYNWVEIANSSSYFDQSSPLLLTTMWSLAVEQQFYLFWPIIVLALVKTRRRWRIAAALAIAAGSVALHTVLVATDVTRAYMGTDTHLWGLMVGAGLAFAAERSVVECETSPSRLSGLWGTAGWLSLCALVAAGLIAENSPLMYPWGMVVASLLALIIIRSLLPDVDSAPAAALRGLLSSAPLSWVGVRSYGIYMWHWPLYVLLSYQYPLLDPLLAAALVVTASVLLADLSYRHVENPIRRMGVGPWFAHIRQSLAAINPAATIGAITLPGFALALAVAAVIVSPSVSSGQQAVEDGRSGIVEGGMGAGEPERLDPDNIGGTMTQPPPADRPSAAPTARPSPEPSADASANGPEMPTQTPAAPDSWDEVTVIGDSVTLASKPAMEEAMPGIVIDAEESRSIHTAPDLIALHAAQGTLGDFLVVSLATNGPVSEDDVNRILDAAGPDRTVILTTAFGPARASWIPSANDVIVAAAQMHPDRVRIADWHSAIADHTDLLAGDAIHPGRQGGRIYADTVKDAVDPR